MKTPNDVSNKIYRINYEAFKTADKLGLYTFEYNRDGNPKTLVFDLNNTFEKGIFILNTYANQIGTIWFFNRPREANLGEGKIVIDYNLDSFGIMSEFVRRLAKAPVCVDFTLMLNGHNCVTPSYLNTRTKVLDDIAKRWY